MIQKYAVVSKEEFEDGHEFVKITKVGMALDLDLLWVKRLIPEKTRVFYNKELTYGQLEVWYEY